MSRVTGRTDDMLIVRGNNVFPSSIEAVVREFPEIVEFRIVVSRQREMNHVRLDIEPAATLVESGRAGLADQLAKAIKQRLQFHAEISLVATGSLPRFEMKAKRLIRE